MVVLALLLTLLAPVLLMLVEVVALQVLAELLLVLVVLAAGVLQQYLLVRLVALDKQIPEAAALAVRILAQLTLVEQVAPVS